MREEIRRLKEDRRRKEGKEYPEKVETEITESKNFKNKTKKQFTVRLFGKETFC